MIREESVTEADIVAEFRARHLDLVRLARRFGSSREAAQLTEPVASAETVALRADEDSQVLRTLAALPRRQREALVLRYYQRLSEAETAEVMRVSRGTVKSATALVYLAQWCDVLPPRELNALGYCSGTDTPLGYRDAQVRSLNVASGGISLSGGSLLLSQSARYPTIVQAIGTLHRLPANRPYPYPQGFAW